MPKDMIGNRMKLLRVERNLTLEELAAILGTTKATLSRYENGQRRFKGEFISTLADFYSVSTDYLLNKTDDRHSGLVDIANGLEDKSIQLSNYARDKKISPEKLKMILDIIDDNS